MDLRTNKRLISAALSHHYAAKSIEISNKNISPKPIRNCQSVDSFILNEFAPDDNRCASTVKRAHLKESLASQEEAQRLQRMCRFLKVS